MSTFDVRQAGSIVIDEIRFANGEDANGYNQASVIVSHSDNRIEIYEGDNGESIRVNGIQHAQYLIKALQKAIELEWLK